MTFCTAPNCTRRAITRKMCSTCYQRWRRTGDVKRKLCSANDNGVPCTLRGAARGLCPKHYERQRQYGTTDVAVLRVAPESRQMTIRFPQVLIQAAYELVAPGESVAAFLREALANEVSRRRVLKRGELR